MLPVSFHDAKTNDAYNQYHIGLTSFLHFKTYLVANSRDHRLSTSFCTLLETWQNYSTVNSLWQDFFKDLFTYLTTLQSSYLLEIEISEILTPSCVDTIF